MKVNIHAEDLFYIYESNNEPVVALRGLHLEVLSGECLVIKGPNGSGKSTFVRLITGFLTPTAGKITIGGQNISTMDPLRLRREFVASIDQKGNLLDDLTVIENIILSYSLINKTHSSAKQAAIELLRSHNLENLATRYPIQLSAGQRQFTSLLAAIATNPKVLIADEPSGELDNASAEIMYKMLKSLAKEASVILVTHDSRAEKYANRVVQIRDGRISGEWLPGKEEKSVIDPFGWMRVREKSFISPKRKSRASDFTSDVLLQAEQLTLFYEGQEIFSNITIEGSKGQLIALSSASGSGKSSLLRILCGIQNPTSGQVLLQGVSLRDLSRQDRAELRKGLVGFLGQGGGALGNISLKDHFGNLTLNLDSSFVERLSRPLSSFSGGERARIELLKILAEKKPILLLDEPTSQMDEHRSLEAAEMLLNFVDQGGLIVTSTRDNVLLENADKVIGAQ